MRERAGVAILVVCFAACQAEVPGGDDQNNNGSDAGDAVDARVIDAAPDALPCDGGTENATDGSSCYEAFLGTLLTWAEARAACQARGGDLARIESLPENQIVIGLVGPTLDAWIGGSDLAAEMVWVWSDGAAFTYDNWRDGEPNNGNDNFQEDCQIIEGDQGGTWDDRPCAPDPTAGPPGEYSYVCER